MTDIPSCSFGSVPKWFYKDDSDLLTLFKNNPTQPGLLDCVPPFLRRKYEGAFYIEDEDTTVEECWRLPKAGKHIGTIGAVSLHLWEWSLTYRAPRSTPKLDAPQDFPAWKD